MKAYDSELATELVVNASSVGLGAVLTQESPTGETRTVAYVSKALSPVEQRYPQTDRETLAIIWAAEHFRLYTLGRKFKVITDHKPLIYLFDKPTAKLSSRLERWMLRKQAFEMDLVYAPGSGNAADYLSRHPEESKKTTKIANLSEEHVNLIAKASCYKARAHSKRARSHPTRNEALHLSFTPEKSGEPRLRGYRKDKNTPQK